MKIGSEMYGEALFLSHPFKKIFLSTFRISKDRENLSAFLIHGSKKGLWGEGEYTGELLYCCTVVST